jgi:hypothetical protein
VHQCMLPFCVRTGAASQQISNMEGKGNSSGVMSSAAYYQGCCNWPVRAETTGGALGAAMLGNVGTAAFMSAGGQWSLGGGGTGGDFTPWDVVKTVLVLLLLLLPPPPPVPTLADAWRRSYVGVVARGAVLCHAIVAATAVVVVVVGTAVELPL